MWKKLTLGLAAGIQPDWLLSAHTSLGASGWDWRVHVSVSSYSVFLRVVRDYASSSPQPLPHVVSDTLILCVVMCITLWCVKRKNCPVKCSVQFEAASRGYLINACWCAQFAMSSGLDCVIKTFLPTYQIMLFHGLQIEMWGRPEACWLQRCSRYEYLCWRYGTEELILGFDSVVHMKSSNRRIWRNLWAWNHSPEL